MSNRTDRTSGPMEPAGAAARGAGALDGVARDVRYAWRSFIRSPSTGLTIVATVGLGLGLVAVVFTILNAFVLRADEVSHPYELFAVQRQPSVAAPGEAFSRPQYEQLVRETGLFSDAFATTPEIDAWVEGRRLEGPLVTGNAFQVLGVSAALGRTLTASDDEPGRPPVIVLSHHAWSRHFGGDPAALNRAVRVNGASFQIVGVMPDGFRGLMVMAPDFWAPLSLLDRFRPDPTGAGNATGLQIVGRLKAGLSRGEALARLLAWDARRATDRSRERSDASLGLEPRPGTVPRPLEAMMLFTPLFFAFGLVLLIACANVANLLLARGVARGREIGIRLAIGASRRRVIAQLLVESVVLALFAAALGFAISRLVLAGVVHAVTSSFPPDLGNLRLVVPPADWRVALFLVAGALVSTLVFALAPALEATRVEPVRAMRGEGPRDVRPGRVRDALLVLQVTGSVLLLIPAAVFLRSAWAASTVDPGIRTAGIVSINVLAEQRRDAILQVVRSEPLVAAVAASLSGELAGLGGRPAVAEGASGKAGVRYQLVSPEYLGVLGIDLVRGRGFSESERQTSAAVAIVSDAVARQLWPGADALGQVLRLEPDATERTPAPDDGLPLSRSVVVVGVARDVAGFRLGGMRMGGAGVYMPTGINAAGTSLTLRVRGDAEHARRVLVDRLAAIDPNMSEVVTLQTIAGGEAYLLAVPFWLSLGLGALALLLALSGIFSVLSHLVEQRTREIGVRMALGATPGGIAALVLSQAARPVGVGLLLGGSLTAALGGGLLATPAAGLIGSSIRLFDPLAYAAGLLWIVAACICAALIPALRAARIDPIGALRHG